MAIANYSKGRRILTPKGYVYEYEREYDYWVDRMEYERQLKEKEMERYYNREYYDNRIAWTSATTTSSVYVPSGGVGGAGGSGASYTSAPITASYVADQPTSNLDWLAKEVDKICAKTRNPVPQKVLKPTFTVSAA